MATRTDIEKFSAETGIEIPKDLKDTSSVKPFLQELEFFFRVNTADIIEPKNPVHVPIDPTELL